MWNLFYVIKKQLHRKKCNFKGTFINLPQNFVQAFEGDKKHTKQVHIKQRLPFYLSNCNINKRKTKELKSFGLKALFKCVLVNTDNMQIVASLQK